MTGRISHLWQHHKLLVIAFAIALTLTLMFTIRTIVFFVYWSDPAHREQPLEPWMTPRYIANSYDRTPEEILSILDVTQPDKLHPTLDYLARQKGISTRELIHQLTLALAKKHD